MIAHAFAYVLVGLCLLGIGRLIGRLISGKIARADVPRAFFWFVVLIIIGWIAASAGGI